MSQFDIRGQKVKGNQYIAGHDMNFGLVQNSADLVAELEKLKDSFIEAKKSGILSGQDGEDAERQVAKAAQEAKQVSPDKRVIIKCLNVAKSLIEGMTSASGLVASLVSAIEAVRRLFP